MNSYLTTQIAAHGYIAVFVLMVLESACIPVPSEAVMTFGGALAGGLLATNGHAQVSLLGIGAAGAIGNLVGSWLAYAVGRYGGEPFIDRWGRYVLLRRHDLDRAHVFFERHGTWAVLVGRVLPVVRTFISLPAGVARMPLGRFSVLTLLGSVPWTYGLAYAGYALADHWDTVSTYFTPISVVIVVAALAAIAWWAWRRKHRGTADRADASGDPDVSTTRP